MALIFFPFDLLSVSCGKLCQVFDLSAVKPHEFVQYGLSCLEKFAALGDTCAKETREKIRVVVCMLFNIIMAPFCFLNTAYSPSAFFSGI